MLLEALIAIPNLLSSISQVAMLYRNYNVQLNTNEPAFTQGPDSFELILALANFLFLIGIYILVFNYCIFKTDVIIEKLKLDKGYEDERFEFNIHRSTILKIAIIIIGGLLLVDSFPLLCEQTLSYFKRINNYKSFASSIEAKYIVYYFIKTFIGFFMLTCSRMIVNYIELKRKNPITNTTDEI